jgi:hypothetical protein
MAAYPQTAPTRRIQAGHPAALKELVTRYRLGFALRQFQNVVGWLQQPKSFAPNKWFPYHLRIESELNQRLAGFASERRRCASSCAFHNRLRNQDSTV